MAANVAQNMGTGQAGAYTAAPDPSAAPPIQGSTPMMEQFYQNAQANGNTIGGMNGIPTLQNQAYRQIHHICYTGIHFFAG